MYRNSPSFIHNLSRLCFDTGDDPAIRQQVEVIAVENRRGNVSGALVILPDDILAAAQITRPTELNRNCLLNRESGINEDHSISSQWRCNGVALVTFASPQLLASLRVVGNDELISAGDQFGALGSPNDERGRPACLHLAWRLPNFFSGLFIQGENE